jgi:hypothetical protein
MTDKAISPLRRRMIEDMTIRKLARETRRLFAPAIALTTLAAVAGVVRGKRLRSSFWFTYS